MRDAAGESGSEHAASVAALQRRWTDVCQNLSDAMGDVGLSVLVERAIARTEPEHPASKRLQMKRERQPDDGAMDAVESHGLAAARDAIEAVISALIDILARLIGEDMAIRIIDPGNPGSNTDSRPAAP